MGWVPRLSPFHLYSTSPSRQRQRLQLRVAPVGAANRRSRPTYCLPDARGVGPSLSILSFSLSQSLSLSPSLLPSPSPSVGPNSPHYRGKHMACCDYKGGRGWRRIISSRMTCRGRQGSDRVLRLDCWDEQIPHSRVLVPCAAGGGANRQGLLFRRGSCWLLACYAKPVRPGGAESSSGRGPNQPLLRWVH